MFGINSGFDLIIGNPPYLESRSPNFKNELKEKLQKAIADRWFKDSHFISRGSDLLIYFLKDQFLLSIEKDGLFLLPKMLG